MDCSHQEQSTQDLGLENWDTSSTTTFFVFTPFTFHVAAIRCARSFAAWALIRFQSDLLVGVSAVVGARWWCDVVGGIVSASVVAAGVVVGRNQLVRGFVPVVRTV